MNLPQIFTKTINRAMPIIYISICHSTLSTHIHKYIFTKNWDLKQFFESIINLIEQNVSFIHYFVDYTCSLAKIYRCMGEKKSVSQTLMKIGITQEKCTNNIFVFKKLWEKSFCWISYIHNIYIATFLTEPLFIQSYP